MNFSVGDVCVYSYGDCNHSIALVRIVDFLPDGRGAVVKFVDVFVDDTGNGLFNYLLASGKPMNASFEYLRKIDRPGGLCEQV